MIVHVALLRGINVGGKNTLTMRDLAALFTDAGCTDVRTYIQSGNVIFAAGRALVRDIPLRIATAIERRFRLRVPVLVRSADDLRRIAGANPYVRAGADTHALHVAFLADEPAAAKVAALDPKRSPPDEFTVRGREIYLRCPNGVARSKLTNDYFDTQLATTSTLRNWRTLRKLIDLTGG